MSDKKIRVIYITGWGRSGTTILGNILGQINGFFHAGELPYVWKRDFIKDSLCSCGVSLRECEVWKSVFDLVFKGTDQVDTEEMHNLFMNGARTRHIPLMLISKGRKILKHRIEKYISTLEKFYQDIQTVTGSTVIVDSSKLPSYGYILSMIPSIELHVIHFVRDPRATAFSWMRNKYDPGIHGQMVTYNPIKNSLLWISWNSLIRKLFAANHRCNNYMLFRYEDFVLKPKSVITDIVHLLRKGHHELPFINDHQVIIEPGHIVSGNPVRFDRGEIGIRADTEWMSEMSIGNKLLVTFLTWPLLLKYKYPLFVPKTYR